MKKTLSVGLVVLFLLTSGSALASALSKPVQVGPKAIGMGGAFVGIADDPTAIYHNTAGMTQLTGHTVEVGMDSLITNEEYTPPTTGVVENAKREFLPVPQFGYVSAGFKPFYWGLGVFFPHGNGGKFSAASAILTNPTEGRIYSMEIDPAVAFELMKGLSVGGSLRIVRLSSTLKNALFQVGAQVDTLENLTVTGWGVGGSFGVLYKPMDWLSFGVNWRSKVTPALDGDAKFTGLGTLAASFEEPLPMLVTAGFGFKPMENLTLGLSYDFEANSEIKTLNVALAGVGTIPLDENYSDSHTIHVGAEFWAMPAFAMRAGWAKDLNDSIPDDMMNRIVGDIAAHEVSFGLAFKVKALTLEGTWNARFGSRTIPVTATNLAPGYYNAFVQMVSLGAKLAI
ncbi:MAG: outer membrane protein transport protein [Pseudomonadota bacterium]